MRPFPHDATLTSFRRSLRIRNHRPVRLATKCLFFTKSPAKEFVALRPRSGVNGIANAETLLIYLRSLPVQTILKWSQDGSQHPRFNEAEIGNIPVPKSVGRAAVKIGALADEALAARAESDRLLQVAKANVDRAVLGQ